MLDNYRQPRWWVLYLTMPLAALLFFLIKRAHPAGAARGLLEFGALLILLGYVEVWCRANTVSLLHHPLTDGGREPIYYAWEAGAAHPVRAEKGIQAVLVTDSRYDLFPVPVYVGEPEPSNPVQPTADAESEGAPVSGNL
jgi:hypothetical protein